MVVTHYLLETKKNAQFVKRKGCRGRLRVLFITTFSLWGACRRVVTRRVSTVVFITTYPLPRGFLLVQNGAAERLLQKVADILEESNKAVHYLTCDHNFWSISAAFSGTLDLN